MTTTFYTQRLLVRPLNLNDASFILELVNTKGWLKYIGDRKIETTQDALDYIQKIISNPNYFYHVIELLDSSKPIGIITFLHRETSQYPDLGFALLPEYQKNGYVFEASNHYLKEIKNSKKIDTILGITLLDNQKSIDLLKKLGFQFHSSKIENSETLSIYQLKFDF